jgi:hypothetical protein
MLRPGERAAHEAAVRAEGFPDYAISPPGERDPLSSIVFLEPFSGRNLRAFGYDMYSEPVRREAMERARDSGEQALSGKLVLVQETDVDVQAGFMIYEPVYRRGMPLNTVDERRAALRGFVYAPLRAGDLMRRLFRVPATEIEVELFDGQPAPGNLLFSSESAPRVALPASHPLVNAASLSLEQLEDYPYIFFEQEEGAPVFMAEEALADEKRHKGIACTDRASLSELIVALNGYTVTSGILVGISDGAGLNTVPLDTDVKLHLGYIAKKGATLSETGKKFVDKLESNLKKYARF